MSDRTILIGDSYDFPDKPLYWIDLVDRNGDPYNFTGATVRTTFKAESDTDPTDAAAVIAADLTVDMSGIETASTGLHLAGSATGGKLRHDLTKAESAAIPPGVAFKSDVVVIDQNGREETFIIAGTLSGQLAYTNRETAS